MTEKELSKLKEIKNKIKNLNITDFNGSTSAYSINRDEPLSKPPENVEQALSARRLALELSITNLYHKAEWQRYWLRSCLTPKCDFIFNVLKHCGIDREEDIKNLCTNSNEPLWDYVPSKELYLDACIKFLLKRYAICKAIKLSWWKGLILSLFSLRLIFGLLVGFYFVILQSKVWEIVLAISNCKLQYWLGCIIFLSLSYFYLLIECHSEVEQQWKFKRVFLGAFLINLFWSYILALVLVNLLRGFFIQKQLPNFTWHTPFLLFASFVMFLSIFVQHFWQEKTVVEPF